MNKLYEDYDVDEVLKAVMQYKLMEQTPSASLMLWEVKIQYANMAQGGRGGDDWEPDGESIRETYYPKKPDSFFQAVCDLMLWPR